MKHPDVHWYLDLQTDPFVQSSCRAFIPIGTPLSEAVKGFGVPAEHVEIFWGGEHVPRENWHLIRPKAFMTVKARVVPGAPIGAAIVGLIGGAWTSATALSIASIGLTITWGQVAGFALTFALQALSSSLFAPKAGSYEAEKDSPETYSVSNSVNQMRPWEAFPYVFGQHRVTPDVAGSYTEVLYGEQYLRMVLLWGYAPITMGQIRIGTTPIYNYEGVEIEHDLEGVADTLALYPNDVTQEDIGVTLAQETWTQRTTTLEANEALITISFPNGLFRIDNEDGDRINTSATVFGEYRAVGSSSWIPFHEEKWTRKENTALYFSKRLVFPSAGEYEIRYRRDRDDTVNSDTEETCVWLNLKSVMYGAPVNAPGIAKSAIRIKATDQLNSAIDTINALVHRKVPVWNGVDWSETAQTSNPAAMFRDVLTGPGSAPEDRKTPHDESLSYWYWYCATNNLTYDKVLTSQVSQRELLEEIAAAGFASPQLFGSEWGVVIDERKSTVVQHFTPRNTWGFRAEVDYPDQPHALRVQFTNIDADYEADERIVYDDGYDESNATDFDVVTTAGVVYPDNVYKIGRHLLASGRLRPERFIFSVDFENLIATRGDLVRLTHDVALVGLASGRIKAISGTTLTLDESVTLETGTDYTIRVRGKTGDSLLMTAFPIVADTETNQISVVDTTGINVGDLFMFGEFVEESILCLVHSITPGGDLSAELTCIPYTEAVYDSYWYIPEYESVVSDPSSLSFRGPALPKILGVISDENALPTTMTGDIVPAILIYLQPGDGVAGSSKVSLTAKFRITYQRVGSSQVQTIEAGANAGWARIPDVEAGAEYRISVQAIDNKGAPSEAVTVSHTVVGLNAKPPAVDTFRVAVTSTGAYVEWTYPSIVADVVGFELRWHADQDMIEWGKMLPLASDVPVDARSYMVPSSVGSFAIKPFDVLGNRSKTALYVNSGISDPDDVDIVESTTEYTGFAGVMNDVVEVDGKLQLAATEKMSDWGTLDTVGILAGTPVSRGTYEFWGEQDLGGVITVGVSWSADINALNLRAAMSTWNSLADLNTLAGEEVGDEYSVYMEMAYSRDDVSSGAVFTDWERLTAGEFTARWFKFRLVMETRDPSVLPQVEEYEVTLDVYDRTEGETDRVSGAGADAVTFASAFLAPPSVSIAAQDMQSGDYHEIASKSATGFTITFKNSSGTAVSRTYDWQALGYGKETS
tara:strand:- start:5651 stop:9280 length:3630 start_codon:yes stop_codon:yes gene_type:complete